MERQVYAAMCRDEALRLSSSSGGIFTLLAEAVLQKGGVVFGAAFTENMVVRHIAVETPEDLWKLRGSKYVRSKPGNSFDLAREYLEAGRIVLFTGTPCQIGLLKAYLKRDYVNLICQDLACHGSPMEWVWEGYVNQRKQEAGAPAISVNFRDKVTGWEAYSLTMDFENGSRYTQRVDRDPYMKVFLRDYTLGKSCYYCAFKGLDRQADITLADLWGAAKTCPDLSDGKGTSAVFLHTEKGVALWEEISPQLRFCPIDEEAVVRHNPSLIKSVPEPKNRQAFLDQLKRGNFDGIVRKFCPPSSRLRRALGKVKRLILH